MAQELWSTIPWKPIADSEKTIGWHKKSVPYTENATYLQTVDIWIPPSSTPSTEAPPPAAAAAVASENPSSLPTSGPWIIYIHGGAWRDPLVDSTSFSHTAENILRSLHSSNGKSDTDSKVKIAGLASINYRLSPHPHHPTHPAPTREEGVPLDKARTALHPQHIHDILTALSFLQKNGVTNNPYILAGHSCGATLAFQAVMDPSRWGYTLPPPTKPSIVVGLNGLYDVLSFIASPPDSHKSLVPIYEAFTIGAFGSISDSSTAMPVIVADWATEWPSAKSVVLVQSKEDKLVPYSQLEMMRARLAETGMLCPVVEMEAGLDHNEMWSVGTRLAEMLMEVAAGDVGK